MTSARRIAVIALALGSAALLPVPAAASARPQPAPGTTVRIDPPLVKPNAVYPVETIMFPTATADGAVVEGGGSVAMSADVMFDFGKATLTPRAGQELARVAGELTAARASTVEVLGHTDAAGADDYNLALSRSRADAVRAWLVGALGPAVTVSATGKGETEPIADNATEAGRALNRRVQIVYG